MKSDAPRSAMIDALRAFAIIAMIVYHAAWDLQNIYGWNINVMSTPWKLLERGTAGIFLFLVGLCFVISWTRDSHYQRFLLRGLKILGFAAVVSVATYAMDPATFVRFGVLHLIGVSTVLLPLLAPLRYWNLLLGVIIVSLGETAPNYATVDYFPMIPWFGVILIGTTAGFAYVRRKHRTYQLPSFIEYISKHSLLIYMVHQPLLLIALRLLLAEKAV